MTENKQPHLPIGYWLRKADEALTSRINAAQQATGLSRTDWQVLNVLNEETAVTREHLAERLRPFADTASLADVLARLGQRGLVAAEGAETAGHRITDQGRSLHDTALQVQMELRQQAVRGVSEPEYATALRVLQQIVHNLEAGQGS